MKVPRYGITMLMEGEPGRKGRLGGHPFLQPPRGDGTIVICRCRCPTPSRWIHSRPG